MESGYYKTEEKITGYNNYDRQVRDENGNLLYTEHLKEPIIEIVETWIEFTEEEILGNLRNERERQCFSIINRGQLWYANLTSEQLIELQNWYKDWLDITETKIIPQKPNWIKG